MEVLGVGARRFVKGDTVQPALRAQSPAQLIVVLVRPSTQEIDAELDLLLAAHLGLERLCPEHLRARFRPVVV